MPWYQFNRSSYFLLSSSASDVAMHRRLAPMTTGLTGAEELASAPLSCSLVNSMVLAPMPLLGTIGSTGASWLPSLDWTPVLPNVPVP